MKILRPYIRAFCVALAIAAATPAWAVSLSVKAIEPTASDNHQTIANGPQVLFYVSAQNNSATINYLRFYDAGTGFNGCGSATNYKFTLHIPANTNDAGLMDNITTGIVFLNGISICVTSGYGNTDQTNATATAIDIAIGYHQ